MSFKVKVEGFDYYVSVGYGGNITWNVGEIIRQATGLEWKNEANNGLVMDIIPYIEKGKKELIENGEKYKHLESPNGWGTVKGTIRFLTTFYKNGN